MHAHRPLVDFALGSQFCPGGPGVGAGCSASPEAPQPVVAAGCSASPEPPQLVVAAGCSASPEPPQLVVAVRCLASVGAGCSASAGPAVGGWARLFSFP